MSNYQEHTRRVLFVLLDIEGAPLRVTTAGQSLYWDQGLGGGLFEWLGAGSVASIDGLGSNTQMSAQEVRLTISCVENDHVTELDDHAYMGRDVKIWQCDLSGSYQVERAILRFQGFMDSAAIRRGKTSTITMSCKSAHATWARRHPQRLNHETQQRLYPSDMGMQYMSSINGLSLKR